MSLRLSNLPAFPLNVVVFPGETFKLHIFEPRYKQLVEDCFDSKQPFAIPFVDKKNTMPGWGSIVLITRIEKSYPNGESDIQVEGLMPFKVADYKEFKTDKLYGAVAAYTEGQSKQEIKPELSNKAFGLLSAYIPDVAIRIANTNQSIDSFKMAALLNLPQAVKYDFLTITNEDDRFRRLINEIKILIQIKKNEEATEKKYLLN